MAGESSSQVVAVDFALGYGPAFEQDHGDAPVVLVKQAIVSIDVGQQRLVAEFAQHGEGVLAKMAALAGDENEVHVDSPPSLPRQLKALPCPDQRTRALANGQSAADGGDGHQHDHVADDQSQSETAP